MKIFFGIVELSALLITCVAFAVGFNAVHNALMYIHTGDALDETTRLLEQAQQMFIAVVVFGSIFLVLFLTGLLKSANQKDM